MLIENKQCCTCKEIRLINCFYKDKSRIDGLYVSCKECHLKRTKRWAINNPDRVEAHRVTYLPKHRINSKKYRENNKEEAYIWRQNNKDSIRQKKNNRRKNDINCRLADYLRSRIRKVIIGIVKSGSAVKDLGCSIEQLKGYIEKRFYLNSETGEKMSWENYGFYGWHIDHVIPLSAFDLSNPEQFKKAVHYTNLQPLWMKENLSKNNKLI